MLQNLTIAEYRYNNKTWYLLKYQRGGGGGGGGGNGIKWHRMEIFSMEKMEKSLSNSPFMPFMP